MTEGSGEKPRAKEAVDGVTWITINRVTIFYRPVKIVDILMSFETYLQSHPEAWTGLMTVFLKCEHEVTY